MLLDPFANNNALNVTVM